MKTVMRGGSTMVNKKNLIVLLTLLSFPGWMISNPRVVSANQLIQPSKIQINTNVPAYTHTLIQNTANGLVKGYLDRNTMVWKGIPYGTAGRWKAPQPPKNWKGILDGTKPGPIAIQGAIGKTTGQEECLNLDVFRPNTTETNLPVLLYIHGGNNQTGSSAQQSANFQQLAEKANIVVIPINHRLGALGFNPLPALKEGTAEENSGNYAVLDFVRSLDWIKDNIKSFGGDPDNITISGFSAGGRDVMALLISPIAKGKFQKAISISGGMTVSDMEWAQNIFAEHFAPLVVADGIKKNEAEAKKWLLEKNQDVRNYLMDLPAERVAAAFGGASIRMYKFPHLYPDGVVLEKKGFDTKTYNQVPLMMITGTNEFSQFAKTDPYFNPAIADKTIFTNPELAKEYRFSTKYGSKLYGLFNAEESAVKMFDSYKAAPIYTMAIAYGGNPLLVSKESAFITGATHGIWRPVITGYPTGGFPDYAFANKGALAMIAQTQAYIGNFMRTGNPNGKGLVEWKAWTGKKEGPAQLIVDATADKAVFYQESQRVHYDDILKEMENDKTISEAQKEFLIKNVLNERWFSKKLDKHFKNKIH